MKQFIRDCYGTYHNVKLINNLVVKKSYGCSFHVVANAGEYEFTIRDEFDSHKEAQKWLDELMEDY